MVSIKSIISGALLACVALAQAPNASFPQSDIQTLLGGTPPSAELTSWCKGQNSLCGSLCGGRANSTCDQTTLNYTCLCLSNNSMPALQYYSSSLVSQECNTLQGNCNRTNANDLAAQENCARTYVCGNATDAQASAAGSGAGSSSSMATSATGSASAAASTGASSATPSHAGAVALNYPEFGPGAFAMMMLSAIAAFL